MENVTIREFFYYQPCFSKPTPMRVSPNFAQLRRRLQPVLHRKDSGNRMAVAFTSQFQFGSPTQIFIDPEYANRDVDQVDAALDASNELTSELASLRAQLSATQALLEKEEDEVHCCPHCDHTNCDGNCDFRCRKVAKREGCAGKQCGARSCLINHRTHFAKASDLIDFEAGGGTIGGDITRVVK